MTPSSKPTEMKFMTEAQIKLVTWLNSFRPSDHDYNGEEIPRLLEIIHRQNLVIEDAVQFVRQYGDKSSDYKTLEQRIELIMKGGAK